MFPLRPAQALIILVSLSLFASLFSAQIVAAIEISFSAKDSGSAFIDSIYDVDTGVAVSEEASASFGNAKIEDTRTVSGNGNIDVSQSYSGSGGYQGDFCFKSMGSGSLTGLATLTPGSLSASQNTISGPDSFIGAYLPTKGGIFSFTLNKPPGADIYTINICMKWPAKLFV